ncbi:MAG: hypothetical protein NT001_05510 [Candidatus Woesearchaeota archaeon]|nr:hypothetical protein [Candidatus Woesearchaeota archaeon]
MGLEEKIAAEKSLPERIWARAKPIAEMSLEKIADAASWAGGIAVGAGAYYILNNINFVGIDFLLIDSLTESQKLIYSLGLSSLFAVIMESIQIRAKISEDNCCFDLF